MSASNSLSRKPVGKFRRTYVSQSVTTSVWTQLIASLTFPCSYIEIFDSSGSIMKLSTGAAADEDNHEIPYYVIPGGSGIFLPIGLSNKQRLSIKAVDKDATSGDIVINFFG